MRTTRSIGSTTRPLHAALRLAAIAGTVAVTGALAACSNAKQPQVMNMETYRVPPAMASNAGSGIGNLLTLGGKSNGATQSTGVAVNAYLWRASLDTLSFMPLASADPFAGVIITDWYSPAATPNERFKATAYVLGTTLSANDVKVSIFRQTRSGTGGGGWVDQPVDPATANGIEDRILARAAQLKAAGQLNG